MSGDAKHAIFREMSSGSFGGFAARLADAWFVADSNNRERIEEAFPDMVRRVESYLGTRVSHA